VARQEFVCMAPDVMVTVGKSEEVLFLHDCPQPVEYSGITCDIGIRPMLFG